MQAAKLSDAAVAEYLGEVEHEAPGADPGLFLGLAVAIAVTAPVYAGLGWWWFS